MSSFTWHDPQDGGAEGSEVQVEDAEPLQLAKDVGSIWLEDVGAQNDEHWINVVQHQAFHVGAVVLGHLSDIYVVLSYLVTLGHTNLVSFS